MTLLSDLTIVMRLVDKRSGIGTRLKQKFSSVGIGARSGCGGCGQTAAKLDTMSREQVMVEIDSLLSEMEQNIQAHRDVLIRFARNATTQEFRREFTRAKLLESANEAELEEINILCQLSGFRQRGNVPAPVLQFVDWLESLVMAKEDAV
jgi:hypothetical protein